MYDLIRLHHLRILQLNEGASDKEIRRAYRRLSKRYHPDVNSDAGAVERFIEIKEAYEYLIGNHFILTEEVITDRQVRERWKAEARARAKQRAWEDSEYRKKMLRRFQNMINPVVWIILIFNVLLSVDYVLPRNSYQPVTYRIEEYKSHDVLFTDEYIIELIKNEYSSLRLEDLRIMTTPALKNFVEIKFTAHGETVTVQPRVGVYAFYGYLIPIIILVTMAYAFFQFSAENRLTLGIFLTILAIIQLVMIARFG